MDDKTRMVQIKNGERINAYEENTVGVFTDAGIIPWDDIDGFWSFHAATQRWMFIPL